ncbi:MAG: methionine--tRNA ligase [Planctomycetota bacterium]|nr:methionine--tRNA ligase [Planctomycetota bacterium]
MKSRRVLITAALPYANNHPHLGHVAGVYLPADTYHRFLKLMGTESIFICGSDDHGAAITISAQNENSTPQAVVKRYRAIQEKIFLSLGIEFDYYSGTSTSDGHDELSQEFFLKIRERGDIEEKYTDQYRCDSCDMFLPDRYVEGTCPLCGADGARGDQCDSCGGAFEQDKLLEPLCVSCGAKPDLTSTQHWFFRLDRYEDRLKEWLESREGWRDNVRNFSLGTIKEGLPARSITRDLEWGVPVPLEEAKDKVLYVWFDAPVGYISFTREMFRERGQEDEWRSWWQDDDVDIVHFIGKDNIIFHAVIWPAMLLGHDQFQLPSSIPANEFLNFKGEKFSKSRGVGVTAEEILELFEADRVRYYLTAVAPEAKDTSFTWEEFVQRNNDELSDVIGNLAHRVFTFTNKNFDSKIPEGASDSPFIEEVLQVLQEARQGWSAALHKYRFREALDKVVTLARHGNRLFDAAAPWKSRKTDQKRCGCDLAALLEVVHGVSVLLLPFVPETAGRLVAAFEEAAGPAGEVVGVLGDRTLLQAGHAVTGPGIVYPRLELPEDEEES